MKTVKALHIINTSAKFAYYQNKDQFYNKANAYAIKKIVLGIFQKYYGEKPKGFRRFPIGYGIFFKIDGFEFHCLSNNKPRSMRQLSPKKQITPYSFYRIKEVKKAYAWLIKFIERHEYELFIPTESIPKLNSYQWKLNSRIAYREYFETDAKEKYRGLADFERSMIKLNPTLLIK